MKQNAAKESCGKKRWTLRGKTGRSIKKYAIQGHFCRPYSKWNNYIENLFRAKSDEAKGKHLTANDSKLLLEELFVELFASQHLKVETS